MKNILITLSVVIAITAGLIIAAPKKSDSKNWNDLSLSQINKNMENGSILVDVRTAKEFNLNHAVGSINFSVEDIKAGKVPTDDKNKVIYVYCRSGKRASDSKVILDSKGYKKVVNLTSLKQWISIGGKTIDSTGRTCNSKDEKAC